MTALDRAALAADLADRAFAAPARTTPAPPRVGAEAELIPIDSTTGQRCWALPFLRRYGAGAGWQEGRTSKDSPCFQVAEGGTITFEPGGQVEFSTPPMPSATGLLALLDDVLEPLIAAAATDGIDLLAAGIDPYNDIACAPIVIRGSRYERMAAYFAQRHPAGALMMRQTAAFQVSLDVGETPWLCWRMLNAAAPYSVAIFANSPMYAGKLTGSVSTRADVWRSLDPSRTGLPYDGLCPLEAYLEFALEAPAMLLPAAEGEHRPFRDWLEAGTVTLDQWDDHLSTLFPEVRPRGRFECRSADAIPPRWYAAPVALAVGLAYSPDALHAAADLLGAPDSSLLGRASRLGLHDPAIASTARALVDLAVEGCRRLGAPYFDSAALERADLFFDRYTRQGRCLADDGIDAYAVA